MASYFSSLASEQQSKPKISPLFELWILRILVPLQGYREFMTPTGIREEELAELIGLGDWIVSACDNFEFTTVLSKLRQLHKAAESKYHDAKAPACLASNVQRLAKLTGLSEVDCRILEFAVCVRSEQILESSSDLLNRLSASKFKHVLSVLLNISERDIQTALSADGLLARSGLVVMDRGDSQFLNTMLELLSSTFASCIVEAEADPVSFLREAVVPSTAPHLQISDFEHLTPAVKVLQLYLRQAIDTQRKGVNIFLYGSPGTGKNQLTKVIAKELGCDLYEVASEDGDGDPVSGNRRLRCLQAAQTFFANRGNMLLFDEAEDVFNDGEGIFGKKSTAQTRKAWVNRTLEENKVPTLWLSNNIHCLDPAFVRRFDMVIELPVPPKKQRTRIIEQACAGLLDTRAVARIAECDTLSPAVVTRAASVVGLISQRLGADESAHAVEMLIGNTLLAQGHRALQKHNANSLPAVYDPAFVHADTDLTQIAAGLVQSQSGRLCLFGPPGTGKTAFAHWLADQMGVPLVVKRASDLMSKYVGGNEKNIATAFNEADQNGAVLLIDEVDSFLRDRRGVKDAWEVTLVNEMLTQMESFSGVFIAPTNLMEGLDQAALRRFDLKVKFDYLLPAQAFELMNRYCHSLGFEAPSAEHQGGIARLVNLTPGDFATVARQHRFRPLNCASNMLAALQAECSVKEGVRASIGFLQ